MGADSKGSRGFSGLVNLVSDLSELKPLGGSQRQVEASATPDVQVSDRGSNNDRNRTPASTVPEGSEGMSGDTQFILWALAVIFLVILYAMSQNSQSDARNDLSSSIAAPSSEYEAAENNRSTKPDFSDFSSEDLNSSPGDKSPSAPSNTAESSRYDVVPLEYGKPLVGTNNILSVSQIRWCLRGSIQIEAMRGNFNTNGGVNKFNQIVDDFNSRCGSYRYRQGNLGLAQKQVEGWRASIEGAAWAEARQMDQAASTQFTNPSSSLSGDPGPSKALVKEVQMLLRVLKFGPGVADGIIGPQTEGAVRSFQRSNGMHATGQINSFLLQQLRQEHREKYPSQ